MKEVRQRIRSTDLTDVWQRIRSTDLTDVWQNSSGRTTSIGRVRTAHLTPMSSASNHFLRPRLKI